MDDKAAYLFRVGGFDYVAYFHACLRKRVQLLQQTVENTLGMLFSLLCHVLAQMLPMYPK